MSHTIIFSDKKHPDNTSKYKKLALDILDAMLFAASYLKEKDTSTASCIIIPHAGLATDALLCSAFESVFAESWNVSTSDSKANYVLYPADESNLNYVSAVCVAAYLAPLGWNAVPALKSSTKLDSKEKEKPPKSEKKRIYTQHKIETPGYPKVFISYDNHMNRKAFLRICRGAEFIGSGTLNGYTLNLFKHATITESENESLPVAFWNISAVDEPILDQYQYCPNHYKKIEVTAIKSDGTSINGFTYILRNDVSIRGINAQYVQCIVNGYLQLGYAEQIKTVIEPAVRRALEGEGKLFDENARNKYLVPKQRRSPYSE